MPNGTVPSTPPPKPKKPWGPWKILAVFLTIALIIMVFILLGTSVIPLPIVLLIIVVGFAIGAAVAFVRDLVDFQAKYNRFLRSSTENKTESKKATPLKEKFEHIVITRIETDPEKLLNMMKKSAAAAKFFLEKKGPLSEKELSIYFDVAYLHRHALTSSIQKKYLIESVLGDKTGGKAISLFTCSLPISLQLSAEEIKPIFDLIKNYNLKELNIQPYIRGMSGFPISKNPPDDKTLYEKKDTDILKKEPNTLEEYKIYFQTALKYCNTEESRKYISPIYLARCCQDTDIAKALLSSESLFNILEKQDAVALLLRCIAKKTKESFHFSSFCASAQNLLLCILLTLKKDNPEKEFKATKKPVNNENFNTLLKALRDKRISNAFDYLEIDEESTIEIIKETIAAKKRGSPEESEKLKCIEDILTVREYLEAYKIHLADRKERKKEQAEDEQYQNFKNMLTEKKVSLKAAYDFFASGENLKNTQMIIEKQKNKKDRMFLHPDTSGDKDLWQIRLNFFEILVNRRLRKRFHEERQAEPPNLHGGSFFQKKVDEMHKAKKEKDQQGKETDKGMVAAEQRKKDK